MEVHIFFGFVAELALVKMRKPFPVPIILSTILAFLYVVGLIHAQKEIPFEKSIVAEEEPQSMKLLVPLNRYAEFALPNLSVVSVAPVAVPLFVPKASLALPVN